jgi:hypothetical protein
MFEVPFQRWFGVESGRHQFSVIAPDRYGASRTSEESGVTLGLSLLRSTRYPDQSADIGRHQFMYAIDCAPPAECVPLVAERLVRPVIASPYEAKLTESAAIKLLRAADKPTHSYTLLHHDPFGGGGMLYEAIKPTEDERGKVIVRMVAATTPGMRDSIYPWTFGQLQQVNLLERPAEHDGVSLFPQSFYLNPRPMQIISVAFAATPRRTPTPKARKSARPAK